MQVVVPPSPAAAQGQAKAMPQGRTRQRWWRTRALFSRRHTRPLTRWTRAGSSSGTTTPSSSSTVRGLPCLGICAQTAMPLLPGGLMPQRGPCRPWRGWGTAQWARARARPRPVPRPPHCTSRPPHCPRRALACPRPRRFSQHCTAPPSRSSTAEGRTGTWATTRMARRAPPTCASASSSASSPSTRAACPPRAPSSCPRATSATNSRSQWMTMPKWRSCSASGSRAGKRARASSRAPRTRRGQSPTPSR
mmetsp:Transcript_15994/g.39281  ORF Transcript_15994/g.39281 Transcript_15994/m.39281 type:complete len:250 (+) Transcript_15994:626-1375(+)